MSTFYLSSGPHRSVLNNPFLGSAILALLAVAFIVMPTHDGGERFPGLAGLVPSINAALFWAVVIGTALAIMAWLRVLRFAARAAVSPYLDAEQKAKIAAGPRDYGLTMLSYLAPVIVSAVLTATKFGLLAAWVVGLAIISAWMTYCLAWKAYFVCKDVKDAGISLDKTVKANVEYEEFQRRRDASPAAG